MKIGLINENSQATKNNIIYDSLKRTLDDTYEIINFGMTDESDKTLTYVQAGLLAGILLNSKAIDFIVTGCGTGEGALMACNAMPNVCCGLINNPTDAYLFSQINAGNAISMPYAKGFGWGSELTLDYIFEKLFKDDFGGGYPKERVIPEQRNKKILDDIKNISHRNMIDILKDINKDFLKETIDRDSFKNYFFENSKDEEITNFIKDILK